MTVYDNRDLRDHVKTPIAALCGLDRRGTGKPHFRFHVGGRTFAYCYIRKNACSAFKKLIVDLSEHRHLCPPDRNPIDFLVRYHQEDSLAALSRCDATVFVYRHPVERLASLFINKFVMRSGCDDIFADFRQATGREPGTVSFRGFVGGYLSGDLLARDPHVWPQHAHLHHIRYTDAVFIGDLRPHMSALLGPELAERYFGKKTNASEGRTAATNSCLGTWSADELAETFRARGILPGADQIATPDIAEEIAGIYADDLRLFHSLSRSRRREPALN